MKTYRIAVLPGDGIGPEVVDSALKVLDAAQKTGNFKLEYIFGEAGFSAINKHGTNLPEGTIKILKSAHACLKGPMTTPEEEGAPISVAVQIRKMFDLYANVRPCRTYPNASGMKGVDLVIVRENTEGLYSGKERKIKGGAIAERIITEKASERIAEFGFRMAEGRGKKLTYVHKANILRMTDGIFNRAVLRVARRYPEIRVEGMHVDAAAMQLVKNPQQFDVIVTTNLFGDILSDEAAQIAGGVGLAPSANIGEKYAMFEPVHGSAPKYAGKGIANPIAAILACKMMLDYLGEGKAGKAIENAVVKGLAGRKILTRDLGGKTSTRKAGEIMAGMI
ncbi:MAG: isocitrate/isopropylmalate dehydrogenase family protein [Candidatus Aenigmarchaeota archaeon]|nr:isocitrate/isopropylmalate dehydrogenase family protein [Candidatus Aenigmarchaeota archaeon]